MFEIFIELWQFARDFYLQSPYPLRFGYTYWLLLGGLYLYSNAYDSLHGLRRTRTLRKRNYPIVIYAAALMTLALYWLSTQYNWGLDVRLPTIGLSWITGGGFVLLTLGLAMTAWGRASINGLWGANIYSYPSNDDYLVREHAYNLIRHPIYLGQILMAWGTFCVAVNWIFLALPVLVTVFAIVRARNEEKYLLQRFNQTYIEYRDKTNFMLPL